MKIPSREVARPRFTYLAKGVYWRFRCGSLDTSLPGQPGDEEFEDKYAQLHALAVRRERPVVTLGYGTFAFVIEKYFEDLEFKVLSESTQAGYRRYAERVIRLLGDFDMNAATAQMIAGVRNTYNAASARNLRAFISRLYNFASSRGFVEKGVNRARELDQVKLKCVGHVPWSDDEIALMLKHAERPLRTMLIIGLYTGQRPGDVETMQWSDVLGNCVRVRQKKTNVLLDLMLHPVLRQELDFLRSQGPVSGAIVRNSNGVPVGQKAYYRRLVALCRAIPNMPHRTPHGGRYATAAILDEAKCDVSEIQAILGHRTYEQATNYLNARKAAARGMVKMIAKVAKATVDRAPSRATESRARRAIVVPAARRRSTRKRTA